MTFEDVKIVFGNNGKATGFVVWGWEVFDKIFEHCNLVTMCMLRGVCENFKLAVDYAFHQHETRIGVNMSLVAEQVEEMIDLLGIPTVEDLTMGKLCLNPKKIDASCCRKCATRARLSRKLLDRMKGKVYDQLSRFIEVAGARRNIIK